jgi:hypothetical protein
MVYALYGVSYSNLARQRTHKVCPIHQQQTQFDTMTMFSTMNHNDPWWGNEELRLLTQNHPSLKRLRLSGEDRRALRSARSLKTNTYLADLCIEGGVLDIDVALALASALSSNTSIKIFRLERTRLSINGARTLFEALKQNHTIKNCTWQKMI